MEKSYTKIDDFLDIIACDFKKYLSSSQLPFFFNFTFADEELLVRNENR